MEKNRENERRAPQSYSFYCNYWQENNGGKKKKKEFWNVKRNEFLKKIEVNLYLAEYQDIASRLDKNIWEIFSLETNYFLVVTATWIFISLAIGVTLQARKRNAHEVSNAQSSPRCNFQPADPAASDNFSRHFLQKTCLGIYYPRLRKIEILYMLGAHKEENTYNFSPYVMYHSQIGSQLSSGF